MVNINIVRTPKPSPLGGKRCVSSVKTTWPCPKCSLDRTPSPSGLGCVLALYLAYFSEFYPFPILRPYMDYDNVPQNFIFFILKSLKRLLFVLLP